MATARPILAAFLLIFAEASRDDFVPLTNASALPTTSEPSATPTTSAPTMSRSPSISPTTRPTNVPSASPTGPCVPCSNDPSGAMASKNTTCESFRLTESKCADVSYAWRREQTCKLSCFVFGHPYDEDRCCTDLEEVTPIVDTPNATSINRFDGVTEAEGEVTPVARNDDTEYEKRMRKHYNDTPCFDEYDCLSDRLSQNQQIFAGEGICSRDGRLVFGLDYDGSLQWKNCTAGGKTKTYYKDGAITDSFVMSETADFVIYNQTEGVKWELPCDVNVERHAQCYTLSSGSITYDCPYLHLHRGGNVALNYIDGKDWIAANINKFYTFRGQ